MKKNKNSILEVIKLILCIYIMGNGLFFAIMYFLHETRYVKEVFVKTSISVGYWIFMVLMLHMLKMIKHRREKNKEYALLRCSIDNFQIPILTILLDIMMLLLFWQSFGEDWNAYRTSMKSEAMQVPILVFCVFHVYSVFVILQYCCYKVCYTKYNIYVVHFWKKVNISWGAVKKISYYEKHMKEKLEIETGREKLVLCSEVLGEGWEAFVNYVFEMADEYKVVVEYGKKKK